MCKYNIKLDKKYLVKGKASNVIVMNNNEAVNILDDLAKNSPRPDFDFSPVACHAILQIIQDDALLYGFDPKQFIKDNFNLSYDKGYLSNMTGKYLTYLNHSKKCTLGYLVVLNMDLTYHLNMIVDHLEVIPILKKLRNYIQKHRISNKQCLIGLHNELGSIDFPTLIWGKYQKAITVNGITDEDLMNNHLRVSVKNRNQAIENIKKLNHKYLYELTHVKHTCKL